MQFTNIIPTFFGAFLLIISGAALDAQAFDPPAELPPAGFQGTQYVDSKGCIYIRAGVSGAIKWVPRVSRDRRQLCGFAPSFPAGTVEAKASPVPQAAPVEIIATKPPDPKPAQTVATPVLGSSLVVTQFAPADAPDIGAETRILPRHLYDARRSERPVKVPKGYRSAWQDGRLNPRRAEQTLAGQEQMRRVWTDTVPRRLVRP